jgi:hypothetical protein
VAQTAPTDQPSPEARAPQTAEIIKSFGQRCPQVVINNVQTKADFIVLLDHEGGKGALRHKNKVVVFNRVSGDSIVSKSTLSLGGSVQDACEGITSDWAAHGKVVRAAAAPSPAVQPGPRPFGSCCDVCLCLLRQNANTGVLDARCRRRRNRRQLRRQHAVHYRSISRTAPDICKEVRLQTLGTKDCNFERSDKRQHGFRA